MHAEIFSMNNGCKRKEENLRGILSTEVDILGSQRENVKQTMM